jgi:hypothetical protein
MNKNGTFIRPLITEDKIEQIRKLIRENPEMNRTKLSRHLCELWNWCGPNHMPKDISCRDMLRDLDKKGIIVLPASKKVSRVRGEQKSVKHFSHDMTPVTGELRELMPLKVELISSGKPLAVFKSYIDQFHYLGFDRTIGENMKYMIYSRDDIPLACMLFGSAAWACSPRDKFIGWDKKQRRDKLYFATNNSRYLIFPWIRVPCLASHVLSLIAKRISSDWMDKYGHPLYLLETFVENQRFRGTAYQAANWIRVGTTTGRGRDGGHHESILPLKDIYLYPLKKDYRSILCE